MLFKLLPYITLWLGLILVGCTNNNIQQQNPFDLECRIVVLKDSIIKTGSEIIVYKSKKASKLKIDSLQNLLGCLKTNLDSLLLLTIENNYDSIEDNLVEHFNLKTPTSKQETFIIYNYAYNILAPHKQCKFVSNFGPIKNIKKYKAKKAKAKKDYFNYIESNINQPRKIAYPNLPPKHYKVLEIISINYVINKNDNDLIDKAKILIEQDSLIYLLDNKTI